MINDLCRSCRSDIWYNWCDCLYFIEMEQKYFFHLHRNFKDKWFFNKNFSKTSATLYVTVWISYKFDFKESSLKDKLDSVLWYLLYIMEMLKKKIHSNGLSEKFQY